MDTMNERLLKVLAQYETDVDSSIRRFYGNKEVYISYIREFPEEPTMAVLQKEIQEKAWDNAFEAAHALKGLAGNLGFVPLFHAVGELVLALREKRLNNIEPINEQVVRSYSTIVNVIELCTGMKG